MFQSSTPVSPLPKRVPQRPLEDAEEQMPNPKKFRPTSSDDDDATSVTMTVEGGPVAASVTVRVMGAHGNYDAAIGMLQMARPRPSTAVRPSAARHAMAIEHQPRIPRPPPAPPPAHVLRQHQRDQEQDMPQQVDGHHEASGGEACEIFNEARMMMAAAGPKPPRGPPPGFEGAQDLIAIPGVDDEAVELGHEDVDAMTWGPATVVNFISIESVRYTQKSCRNSFTDGRLLRRLIDELNRGAHDPMTAEFLALQCVSVGDVYHSLNNRRLLCLKEHSAETGREVWINVHVVAVVENWKALKMLRCNFSTTSKGHTIQIRGSR